MLSNKPPLKTCQRDQNQKFYFIRWSSFFDTMHSKRDIAARNFHPPSFSQAKHTAHFSLFLLSGKRAENLALFCVSGKVEFAVYVQICSLKYAFWGWKCIFCQKLDIFTVKFRFKLRNHRQKAFFLFLLGKLRSSGGWKGDNQDLLKSPYLWMKSLCEKVGTTTNFVWEKVWWIVKLTYFKVKIICS